MTKVGQIDVEAKLDSKEFNKELLLLEKNIKSFCKKISVDLEAVKASAKFTGLAAALQTKDNQLNPVSSQLLDMQNNYSAKLEEFGFKKQAYEEEGGLIGSLSDGFAKRLEILQWYYIERNKIILAANGDIAGAQEAFAELDSLKNAQLAEEKLAILQQYGLNAKDIFLNTFDMILRGESDFGNIMKSTYLNLSNELVKILLDQALKEIQIEQMKSAAKNMLNMALGFVGGTVGKGISFAKNIFGKFLNFHSGGTIPSHHDGTIVPMGMGIGSYAISGTAEQLALLKGGERVLSPAENVSYEQGSSQSSQVQVLNFNIKAWDGKDVINTLRQNAAVIQQITASGIKNNQNGLRSIVQGV